MAIKTTHPNYKAIDEEAKQARIDAEKIAAQDGLTGWDCTKAGLQAQKRVWQKYDVASQKYREPLPETAFTVDLNSLDD